MQNHYQKPLHTACEKGNLEQVRRLLAQEGIPDSLNLPDQNGYTPLHHACWKGHDKVVELLLAEDGIADSLNLQGYCRYTPLHSACNNGSYKAVELLLAKDGIANSLNLPNKRGDTPLHFACLKGHDQVVELLLAEDGIADSLNRPDNNGKTPLHLACALGHDKVVKLLLAQDGIADSLNRRDKFGTTPLFWASREGHDKVVKLLLAQDGIADSLNIPCSNGDTPLNIACDFGYEKVVELLLAQDGIEVPDDLNSENAEVTNLLTQYREQYSFITAIKGEGLSEAQKKELYAANFGNICIRDSEGDTLLHACIQSTTLSYKDDFNESLLAIPGIFNKKNKEGETALLLAVQKYIMFCTHIDENGNTNENQKAKCLELIKDMLSRRANPGKSIDIAILSARERAYVLQRLEGSEAASSMEASASPLALAQYKRYNTEDKKALLAVFAAGPPTAAAAAAAAQVKREVQAARRKKIAKGMLILVVMIAFVKIFSVKLVLVVLAVAGMWAKNKKFKLKTEGGNHLAASGVAPQVQVGAKVSDQLNADPNADHVDLTVSDALQHS